MDGESSGSDANQQEYERKAYASVVAFKRGEDHMAGGILLTLKHALAVLINIIYLDTESDLKDVIEVGVCFEQQPTRYNIEKLSYNRKDFPNIPKQRKKYEIGIVTVSNSIKIQDWVLTLVDTT